MNLPFAASSVAAKSSASNSCSGKTGTTHRGCDIFSSKAFNFASGNIIWQITNLFYFTTSNIKIIVKVDIKKIKIGGQLYTLYSFEVS